MTELSFDWADMPWEIDQNRRAPQMMKVSVTFKPIHDIPMGMDSTGMMRSVAYPVGISQTLNGTPYESMSMKDAEAHAAAEEKKDKKSSRRREDRAEKAAESASKAGG